MVWATDTVNVRKGNIYQSTGADERFSKRERRGRLSSKEGVGRESRKASPSMVILKEEAQKKTISEQYQSETILRESWSGVKNFTYFLSHRKYSSKENLDKSTCRGGEGCNEIKGEKLSSYTVPRQRRNKKECERRSRHKKRIL